jgi:hypothetical protein
VREKRAAVVMVELLAQATRRLVRWQILQAHWTEPVVPCQ